MDFENCHDRSKTEVKIHWEKLKINIGVGMSGV